MSDDDYDYDDEPEEQEEEDGELTLEAQIENNFYEAEGTPIPMAPL